MSEKLEHLGKARPKRPKTRAPTRPGIKGKELREEPQDIGEGLDNFFKQQRNSLSTPTLSPDSEESRMAKHDISYFRNLWQKNTLDLENQCHVWEKICSDNPIPDDVHGEIRTTIGLAKLLMNKKLKQFRGLIDDSEFHTGEKEITCSDLEGFWDMVYFEVEKILKSFERLNKCKNSDWNFAEEILEKQAKKVPIKKDVSAINKRKETSKAQVLAARQRIAEIKKKMAAQPKEDKDQTQVDILLPNRKLVENSSNYVAVKNGATLNNEIIIKESNEKRKPNLQVSNKKKTPCVTNDLLEESLDLNGTSKQKSAQKKKFTALNKENVFLDKDNSDLKPTDAKQTKFNEPVTQELGERKKKQGSVKFQMVTRSAAKKALLLQNSLQK